MRKNWKKRILCLTVLAICAATLATGTLAYFVAEETAYSVITTGCLYMDLIQADENDDPLPEGIVTAVMPAVSVNQSAFVVNKGDVPFYTRVVVEKKLYAAEGSDAELDPDYVTLNINTAYWKEENGFYFYRRILKPGEATRPLYTKVTFSPQMGNEYQNAHVEINVLGQAVQSDNNGYSATEALGWSELTKTLIVETDDK